MPLQSGSSQKTISNNIRELHKGKTFARTEGKFGKARADKQAIAIAMSNARETKGRGMGGVAPVSMTTPNPLAAQAFNPAMAGAQGVAPGLPQTMGFKHGGAAKSVKLTTGPLVSTVPGRTDLHFTHVPSGAYVIPADIVSAHGQGNTLAGMEKLHKLFNLHQHNSHTMPKFPSRAKSMAKGGHDKHVGKPVPVKLAGGEIVLPPSAVHETMERLHGRKLSLDEAHKHMDKWVVNERKKLRKTLAKLPGPAHD